MVYKAPQDLPSQTQLSSLITPSLGLFVIPPTRRAPSSPSPLHLRAFSLEHSPQYVPGSGLLPLWVSAYTSTNQWCLPDHPQQALRPFPAACFHITLITIWHVTHFFSHIYCFSCPLEVSYMKAGIFVCFLSSLFSGIFNNALDSACHVVGTWKYFLNEKW